MQPRGESSDESSDEEPPLGGSAAALGCTAGYAADTNRKKNRDKQSADSLGMDAMRRAALKKACDLMRKEAADWCYAATATQWLGVCPFRRARR